MSNRRTYALLLLVLSDQITKYLADQHLSLQSITVTRVLKWVLAHNQGAAFSLLAEAGDWTGIFFITLSILVAGCVMYEYFYRSTRSIYADIASVLILAGIFGNLYDRMRNAYVIDFIALHWKTYYWPIFNLADSYLCIGLVFLGLSLFCYHDKAVH